MPSARRLVQRAETALLFVLVAVGLVALWPSSLGGCMTTVVVSGISMEPSYHPGDAVVAWCGTPHVGDVAVYRPADVDGVQIIHRIVGGTSAGWVMRGDNNNGDDPFRPTDHDVVGVAVLRVPGVGTALHTLTSPLAWGGLVVAGAGTLLWPGRRSSAGARAVAAGEAEGASGCAETPRDAAPETV